MIVNLPTPPSGYDREYFRFSFSLLERQLQRTVSTTEAVQGILLQAPDGSVWKVQVTNAGALTTTSVPLGQTGAPTY
ncbi:hypothetical protein UFOVP500_28 [uncultured Caudovirales phage]|uniref:Uncharacterized protein n=1 Tax=uncultured Caudovirales phage TaxID=2100421 RepID=A0A6J5MSJ0_9CAUD|nr:hypothetical protein UFOVP500_28 [uncultured Caudovirales phage]